jgi:Protein of unknown function (DUF3306)
MTTPENPLSRWSRLKREAVSIGEAGADQDDTSARSAGPANTRPEAGLDQVFVDPEDLPPIDAITVDTDIRAFLNSRVPAELTRAALRRAWISDPAIRDFIGIAENQWDFNGSNAMPGFGPLQATDSAQALLAQALGKPNQFAEMIAQVPVSTDRSLSAVTDRAPTNVDQRDQPTFQGSASTNHICNSPDDGSEEGVAINNRFKGDESPRHRRLHGGALPRWDS